MNIQSLIYGFILHGLYFKCPKVDQSVQKQIFLDTKQLSYTGQFTQNLQNLLRELESCFFYNLPFIGLAQINSLLPVHNQPFSQLFSHQFINFQQFHSSN
ncbi:hypothetical protein ABPG72_007244 [Tetrahymena utriculariae]